MLFGMWSFVLTQIARSMWPTWGPPGSWRPPRWPHESCYQERLPKNVSIYLLLMVFLTVYFHIHNPLYQPILHNITRYWSVYPHPAITGHDLSMPIRERSLIARFMGPTWGPHGADRAQVGLMLAPWTLLSGVVHIFAVFVLRISPHYDSW